MENRKAEVEQIKKEADENMQPRIDQISDRLDNLVEPLADRRERIQTAKEFHQLKRNLQDQGGFLKCCSLIGSFKLDR